ncbi:UNVERIFIED_CONTAM: hypothetical protein NY100_05295 [Prevotella sp. 15_C9]
MALETTTVEKIARNYNKVSLWIIAGISLIGLLISQGLMLANTSVPIIVSALFSLVSCVAYGKTWKYFATNHSRVLGKFYMAGSMLRMILATIVVLIGAVIYLPNREKILTFVAIFVIYYLLLMIFDCIYFIKVEKKNITIE